MSDMNLEQRINIKFCVKIDENASEMVALLTMAYGEYAMKKSIVFEWHRRFKEGQENVQDDPRSGQPKTQRTGANVDRVRTLVRSDRKLGVTLIEKSSEVDHPPYSPDVAPCDFWLFPKLKKCPEGTKVC
jgi:hypothetical protein